MATDKNKPREWYVTEALKSFSRLTELIPQLTEAEVLACLELEAGTRRRPSILDRLISRAARLNEIRYTNQLKGKFYGSQTIDGHERKADAGSEG